MKTEYSTIQMLARISARWLTSRLSPLALVALFGAFSAAPGANPPAAPAGIEPIPMSQLGAVAAKEYHGDGLSVAAAADGAVLRCVFQRLEGHVTPEGLWLISTVTNALSERFRVAATAVGRGTQRHLTDNQDKEGTALN